MRAVMLEVPQALLDERRAKGLDKSDEMWAGELHIGALDVGADTIDGVLARL